MDFIRKKTGEVQVIEYFKHRYGHGHTEFCRQWDDEMKKYGYFVRDIRNGAIVDERDHSYSREQVYREFLDGKNTFEY